MPDNDDQWALVVDGCPGLIQKTRKPGIMHASKAEKDVTWEMQFN
eukprot:CAMPEP_0114269630 /NCGR_PEP_ID=MMETSP0058-20121206/26738_1 /TAXON_ID=36894 /ORGANISM="Pyramimonas parkeae, CCMP726" /LENGTH=44 /DNA_ID= /DNA_START= /DNA_END= /DNA_ORIENTATION=